MGSPLLELLASGEPLLKLGGKGRGAVGLSNVAAAKKKKKSKANKACKKQAQVWDLYVTIACEGDPVCLNALTCGDPLETCNFTEFFSCFEALT